jgi:hypothetical protein
LNGGRLTAVMEELRGMISARDDAIPAAEGMCLRARSEHDEDEGGANPLDLGPSHIALRPYFETLRERNAVSMNLR